MVDWVWDVLYSAVKHQKLEADLKVPPRIPNSPRKFDRCSKFVGKLLDLFLGTFQFTPTFSEKSERNVPRRQFFRIFCHWTCRCPKMKKFTAGTFSGTVPRESPWQAQNECARHCGKWMCAIFVVKLLVLCTMRFLLKTVMRIAEHYAHCVRNHCVCCTRNAHAMCTQWYACCARIAFALRTQCAIRAFVSNDLTTQCAHSFTRIAEQRERNTHNPHALQKESNGCVHWMCAFIPQ